MNFPSSLIKGTLIKRYRRSLADVRLEDGTTATVHVFNTGSMAGCSEPGRPVLLSDSKDRMRKHPLTWELINMDGVWVGVNPTASRQVLMEALKSRTLDALREYHLEEGVSQSGWQGSEFILHSMENICSLSLQTSSWAEGGRAFFPDSVSRPALRNLQNLCEVAARGHRAVALYHILREDCTVLHPAESVDREYADLVHTAMRSGVEFLAFRAVVNPTGITLGTPVPFVPE